MGKIWDIYCWFWYNSLWWMDKYARRPFTFIMHDFVHRHITLGIGLILALGAGFAYLTYLSIYFIFLTAFYWMLVGHVTWANWKIGEQEDPPYVGEWE